MMGTLLVVAIGLALAVIVGAWIGPDPVRSEWQDPRGFQ